MPNAECLIGQKFGRLTAIELLIRSSRRYYQCACDCGGSSVVRGDQLKSGESQSCGCYKSEMMIARFRMDLTGRRFNRLQVVRMVGVNKYRQTRCEVLCDCGITKIVNSSGLMNGTTNSCGCYQRDRVGEVARLDLSGRRFGKLLVVRMNGTNHRQKTTCEVLCDCGKTKIITSEGLTKGSVISCGCARYEPHSGRLPLISQSNRNKLAAYSHFRRSQKKKNGGRFTATQVSALYQAQRGLCVSCRGKLGDSYHRDHVVPLSLGGSNDISNIQLLCEFCNLSKGAKDPIVWAQEHGRLL